MKAYLINLLILLLVLVAYYFDIFDWFVGQNALIFSFILVGIMLLIGLKVLGNPFRSEEKENKNDDE